MGNIAGTTKGSFFWFDTNDDRLVVITDSSHILYDRRVEMPIDEDMVNSIADPTIGILEPIIVRKVGENYEVVDGRQRVRAAREAARRYPDRRIRIPAVPKTTKDAEAARNATIANVQRRNDSQSVKGENASRMIQMGWTDDEVASFFGVEVSTINDWVSFSENATTSLKSILDEDEITYSTARKISRLKKEDQFIAIEKALSKPRKKTGPKKGESRRKKIVIYAYEKEEGGFEIEFKNKFNLTELGTVIESLDVKFNELKNSSEYRTVISVKNS